MATITAEEVLETSERAYPAGHPVSVANLAIVDLPGSSPELGEAGVDPFRVKCGEIGEIIVSGAHVNRRYVENEAATRETKLFELDGTVWHRTGDLAYEDAAGRFWLVGRQSYVIRGSVHPFPVEIALDALPTVHRSALVATPKHPNGIVAVVPAQGADLALLQAGAAEVLASFGLDDIDVRTLEAIPVDGRHNSKVDRVSLRALLE